MINNCWTTRYLPRTTIKTNKQIKHLRNAENSCNKCEHYYKIRVAMEYK